jgi:hypothetical protein
MQETVRGELAKAVGGQPSISAQLMPDEHSYLSVSYPAWDLDCVGWEGLSVRMQQLKRCGA